MAETTTERLVSFLPYYFKNGENIKIYFSVFAELFDELIQVFVQIQQSRDIDKSELYGLDILGDIVGELRNGLTDPKYLENLRTKIRRNRSNGNIEILNDFARSILGDDFIGFSETETSGTLQLQYNFPRTNMIVQDPLALIEKIKALGVKLESVLNFYSNLNTYYALASHESIRVTIKPQILTDNSINLNTYYGLANHQFKHIVIKSQIETVSSVISNNFYGTAIHQTKYAKVGSDI